MIQVLAPDVPARKSASNSAAGPCPDLRMLPLCGRKPHRETGAARESLIQTPIRSDVPVMGALAQNARRLDAGAIRGIVRRNSELVIWPTESAIQDGGYLTIMSWRPSKIVSIDQGEEQ